MKAMILEALGPIARNPDPLRLTTVPDPGPDRGRSWFG